MSLSSYYTGEVLAPVGGETLFPLRATGVVGHVMR
jgi:hypothetical protein